MPTKKDKESRAQFLKDARARFEQGQTAMLSQVQREKDDLKMYALDQWPDEAKQLRGALPPSGSNAPAVPARPMLVIDKLRAPIRQVLNQAQSSDLGVELVQADDFAALAQPPPPEEIELREGLVRRIQRSPESKSARLWGFSRAVQAGIGYYRVNTKYLEGKTFDQDVTVERIYDQGTVTIDPMHTSPTGADAEWVFIGNFLSWEQYKAEYGYRREEKNALCDMGDSAFQSLSESLPKWFQYDSSAKTRSVRVVEYFYTERTSRTLYELADGRAVYEDEKPEDAEVVNERRVVAKTIKWCKIDGCDDDVLDETDWLSPYLPIIKCVGEELHPYDSERRIEGMVRPARDSQRSFNYMASKFVERVGMSKSADIVMAAGQDENFESEWDLANTRMLSRLHYNVKDIDGNLVGPPVALPRSGDEDKIAMGLQLFSESIKDTTATPDPSLGNIDPHLRSGKAIQKLVEQSQRGNSHYISNYQQSIEQEGRVVNSLLYPIYGRKGRLARIIDQHGDGQTVMLHQPSVSVNGQPQKFDPAKHPADQAKTFTLTKDAQFNVVVKVTKALDTRREQEASFFADIISSNPELMAVYGDLMFENMDGPGHQEAAERAKAMLAPPVQQLLSGQAPPDPKMLAQQQLAQKVIDELTAQVHDLKDKEEAKTLELDAKKQIALGQAEVDLEKARIAAQTAIAVAEISAKSKADVAEMQHRIGILEAMIGVEKEVRLSAHETAHEAGMQAADHAHEREMAAVTQQHDAAMGTQSHEQEKELVKMTPTPKES